MHLTNYHFYNTKNYLYCKSVKGLSGFEVGYRFSFNGKENDDETQTQDYGFRIYNPSIGKFLSVDPLTSTYPMLTPYQFASNTPIWAVDLDGLEAKIYQSLLKDNMGFKAMITLADQTTLGKEFNNVLKSQNKIDVMYVPLSDKVSFPGSGIITDAITVDKDGFASGSAGATSPMIVYSAEDLLNTGSRFKWIDPKELESSFKDGKGVLLIGVSLGNINAPKKADFTMDKLKNFRISGAETIVHEQTSHGLDLLKGLNIGEFQQHQNYHGDYGKGSPSTKDLATNPKYSQTNGGKAVSELKTIASKVYKLNLNKKN